jgi:hypothetical protein
MLFEGMDYHDSQIENALELYQEKVKWDDRRIILIGEDPKDWVILVNVDEKP